MDIVTLVQEYPKLSVAGSGVILFIGNRILKLIKTPTEKKYIDLGNECDHDDFRMGEKMPYTGENEASFFTMMKELFDNSQKQ